LGGAFNPPHLGHLVLAQEAAWQVGLAEVLLVPVAEPPHRRLDPEPGAEVRLDLVRAAAADDPLLTASQIEVERGGPSFTFRTLELLRERRPDDELVFLMGADAAAALSDWRSPERVVELARLAVAARPGVALAEAEAALDRVGAGERVEWIRMPEIGISSSAIRQRIAAGRPIRHLVPQRVAALIDERGVYRS